MLRPGNMIPVMGTSIDGKYDAVIVFCFVYRLITDLLLSNSNKF